MAREFRKGYLEIDFASEPFDSPVRLVMRTLRLFGARFGTIAAITLLVFLPGNLVVQMICETLDISVKGVGFYLLMNAVDIVLGALAVPALVYGLVAWLRSGKPASIAQCLRWGRRQWGKTLWNEVKVNITVILWGALLVVPGIIAMIRLIFTDVVVAIEGDTTPDPMARSQQLSNGRKWRMFAVLAPIELVNMAAMFLILDRPGIADSRVVFAVADSVLNVFAQLTTIAVLMMYLGLLPPRQKATAKRAA
jgi:hypothetical protein